MVSYDLEYITFPCNPEYAMPLGTYFTSSEKPGLDNLFRYGGVEEESSECIFEIYSAETVEINDKFIENHHMVPVSFSEGFHL